MIRSLFASLCLTVFLLNPCAGQDADTTEAVVEIFDTDDEQELQDGVADSTNLEARKFSEQDYQRLKDDSDLQYQQPPTVAESIWDRFWRFVSEFIESLFRNAVYTDWGRLLLYLVGIGLVILIIMLILKIDAFKVFYARSNAPVTQYNVLDENIHEINFDAEIQKAIAEKDYRRGVRLLFLYALKLLSDRDYILWEQGKTNHEYVAEVKEEGVRNWLHQLSFYFDYAWYGNFLISRDLFDKVNNIFTDWKGKLK